MDLNETIHVMRNLNNFDPRIPFNEPSVAQWQRILAPVTPAEARQAIDEHYTSNDTTAITPAGVRKRALNIRDRWAAKQRALTAEPATTTIKNPNSFRARNPELWDKLFEQGRKEANEERAINGARYGVNPITEHDGELHEFHKPNYTGFAEYPAA